MPDFHFVVVRGFYYQPRHFRADVGEQVVAMSTGVRDDAIAPVECQLTAGAHYRSRCKKKPRPRKRGRPEPVFCSNRAACTSNSLALLILHSMHLG